MLNGTAVPQKNAGGTQDIGAAMGSSTKEGWNRN